MAEINFYLKGKKRKKKLKGKALIFLRTRIKGQNFVYSTGEHIEGENWNEDKQRPKTDNTLASKDQSLLDYLDELHDQASDYVKDELKNGTPTPGMLKAHLDKFRNRQIDAEQEQREADAQKSSLMGLFDRFTSGEILSRGKQKAKSTLNNYRAVKKHLLAFHKETGYPIDFDTINLDFFHRYTAWLGRIVNVNTLAKDIRLLKVVLQEAVDMELTDNLEFKKKKFSVVGKDPDAVALSQKEILKLNQVSFTNKKLEKVRDLFVFGCLTGLRFSDFSRIERENIVEIEGQTFIKILQQKTGDQVIVPVNPIILNVFRKYENTPTGMPKQMSNQKFNEYVKEVCQKAGLTEKGRLVDDPKLELWECVSSHTARRSFCTNAYLTGFPVLDIMKISGHKSEKAFMRYIKVSKLDAAKSFAVHQAKVWSRLMLQAV